MEECFGHLLSAIICCLQEMFGFVLGLLPVHSLVFALVLAACAPCSPKDC